MSNSRKLLKSMNKMILIPFVCFTISNYTIAQGISQPDSSRANQYAIPFQQDRITYKSFIIPTALITTGALGISGEFIIPNNKIKEERDEEFKTFHTSIDNYLQFAPMAAGYAMLINNPKHSFWNYTEKVILTEVMLNAIIQPVKHITKVPRPDTGEPTSFPFGHTTLAFAGATIFYDEFAQHNLILQATIYSGAAAVGVMRVLNNRHWASDVIAGAGFGILSAKLSELIIEPHGRKYHSSYSNYL